ncbi:UxaA family hydrolase [Clostridium aestuarii]|uniref:UxaA family hydrolase n=1 Tax=Clostridium aestuarii TaxID=338193 RepID=A0ABT4D067_9CLOT|nr:UxaA family hydrolase [Clostridium aestuarii]MCY6484629.1 UxaA family hydrolase [Clostridium aestuarii]
MSEKIVGLQVNDLDNVATVFQDTKKEAIVEVIDKKGNKKLIKTLADIPFGHKIAVKFTKKGEQITKYGEEIGVATQNIEIGDYVHIHNLESIRGRGDWKKKEGK